MFGVDPARMSERPRGKPKKPGPGFRAVHKRKEPLTFRSAALFNSRRQVQENDTVVETLRRRIAPPTSAKPITIIAQVAGSGTATANWL